MERKKESFSSEGKCRLETDGHWLRFQGPVEVSRTDGQGPILQA
jgi:hypothetical protein